MQVRRWVASDAKQSVANSQSENNDVNSVTYIEEAIVARKFKFWIELQINSFWCKFEDELICNKLSWVMSEAALSPL